MKYSGTQSIHTYITGHYNPSVRIIELISHTTYVVCVLILYISGGTYSLKSTPYDRFFFEKLFLAFNYSQSFCQKSAERKTPQKYFSYFVGFSSNKPTHCPLDHGDF